MSSCRYRLPYQPRQDGIHLLKSKRWYLHTKWWYLHTLKLVDNFSNKGRSLSSTLNDINTRLARAWTAIDRLSVIWKSDLTDKIKRSFFPRSSRVDTALWMHYMDANVWRKSLTAISQECLELYWTNPAGGNPQNSSCTATFHSSRN